LAKQSGLACYQSRGQEDTMKALILAAGEGTRLRPLTADRPKPMLPLGGVPLLEWIVLLLKKHSVTDIAINLHYKPWTIIHHLGHGRRWDVRIHYSFEETLLGSAGAAKRLEWYFDESFIVFYGDLYTDLDLSKLIAAHRQGGAPITMALYAVDNPTECGIVELDARSRVRRFEEKPAHDQVFSRLANAGVLVVEPEVLSWLPADRHLDFGHDVFPNMLATGQSIVGYPITDTLVDIGTMESYQKAQQLVAQRVAARAQTDLSSQIVAPTVQNVFQRFVLAHSD
jgi:NDP-sugar pyrophosphorylase family protein